MRWRCSSWRLSSVPAAIKIYLIDRKWSNYLGMAHYYMSMAIEHIGFFFIIIIIFLFCRWSSCSKYSVSSLRERTMIKYKTQKKAALTRASVCVCVWVCVCMYEIGSIFHGRFVYTVGTYRHATFTRATISQYTYDIDKDATDQRMENNNNNNYTNKKNKITQYKKKDFTVSIIVLIFFVENEI